MPMLIWAFSRPAQNPLCGTMAVVQDTACSHHFAVFFWSRGRFGLRAAQGQVRFEDAPAVCENEVPLQAVSWRGLAEAKAYSLEAKDCWTDIACCCCCLLQV